MLVFYSHNTANLKSTTYVVVCTKIHILLYFHCRLLIRFNSVLHLQILLIELGTIDLILDLYC